MKYCNQEFNEGNPDKYEIVNLGKDIPTYDIQDYNFNDEKDLKRYIEDIKKDCRGSFEYQQMVQYFREYMDMNKCSFYRNVNNIDTTKIKIHIHHEPFTLDAICKIVYNKRAANNECVDDIEMVAKEVMFLHYLLMFGLIPLAETPHELVHNNYLFVPIDKVLGNYKEFVDRYYEYIEMSPEIMDIYERKLECSILFNEAENMHVLEVKYLYTDETGEYDLPKYEDVIKMVMGQIKNIKLELLPNNKLIEPITIYNK